MTNAMFEDVGAVITPLAADGKQRFSRRNLGPFKQKITEILAATEEANAAGNQYAFQTKVLTGPILTAADTANVDNVGRGESELKIVRQFKAAAGEMDLSLGVQWTHLPIVSVENGGDGQQRTLLTMGLQEKREVTIVTTAKREFGTARSELAKAAQALQADPENEDRKQAVRDAIKIATETGKVAKELTDADTNHKPDLREKLDNHLRETAQVIAKLAPIVKETPPAKDETPPATPPAPKNGPAKK